MKQIPEVADPPDNRGPAIVIHGDLMGGFKAAYGPFETIDAACKWAAPRSMALGWITIYELKKPATCPVAAD